MHRIGTVTATNGNRGAATNEAAAPPQTEGPAGQSVIAATENTITRLIEATRERAARSERGPQPIWQRSMQAWVVRALVVIFGVVAVGAVGLMALGLLALSQAAVVLMPVAILAAVTIGLIFGAPEPE